MSKDAPERSEHPGEVPATGAEGTVEDRQSTSKHSVTTEGTQSQGHGAEGAVIGGEPLDRSTHSERKEEAAPKENQDENASLVAKVPAGDEVEPDVAFAGTEVDTRCGLLSFRPAVLQVFCKPPYMLVNMCAITFTQGFLANGCVNVVLPTLERRFQLRSFESAMIISSYNVANCIAVAPVAFMGTSGKKPVFLGVGAFTVGLGSFLFTSVHFIAPAYQWGSELQDLCPAGALPKDLCLTGDVRHYRFLLMIAHALHGIGSTPFHTLGISYLDENVPTRMVSTYLGVFSCMGVVGPGIGFMVTGFFLRFYVDITKDVKHLGLTSGSAVFVGAWWVPFLMVSVSMFTISGPTLFFPKHMPSYYKLIEQKKMESRQGTRVMKDTSIKELPGAICAILGNITFLSLSLAGTADYMLTNAVTQTSTKFFESQFAISSSKASAILGAVAITGGCGGTFLGGYLVTRLNMSCDAIIRMCLIVSIVPWICIFMFRSYCPDPTFAVNIPAMLNDSNPFGFPCNKHCKCLSSVYNPVCSVDGIVFFSPCLAGCEARLATGKARVYTNCSCITQSVPETLPNSTVINVQARRKKCNTGCTLLPYFTAGLLLALFSNFINLAPLASALLRVVTPKERSLALAVKWIIVRLFASIPGPLLFGHVIDRSCLVWQKTCGRSGSCLYYNNKLLAHNLFNVFILLKTLSILLYALSLIKYRENFGSGRRGWRAA
ncbi:solute carrier organic anion transporter family member 4A1-like isoform X1 [Dermacentor andersoni]|uniref:solute carrier organic anion transporter family member 4A1-like isoform X1 n=1 Tax=Dermacentor andersoni TaxID=34620 RepID=UPI0024164540|nr:solute carrier organic anion transporter family member 4A1-like isoform X1 [Dermacentor andersoni]XP_054929546.1 solute carrier organic anion transporter family member 4A1-like isoform X1 [Dermacentor andersoni]